MERQFSPGNLIGQRFIAASACVHLLAFAFFPGPQSAADALPPLQVQLRNTTPPTEVAEVKTEAAPVHRAPPKQVAPQPTPAPTLLTRAETPVEPLPAVAIPDNNRPPAPITPPASAAPPEAAPSVPALAAVAATTEVRERRGKPSTLWLANYTKTISGQVGRLKQYPSIARLRGWQGTTVISLLLAADGTILQVRVEQSSGHDVLDSQALAMVRQAEPLPPHPERHDGDPLTVRLPIVFALATP